MTNQPEGQHPVPEDPCLTCGGTGENEVWGGSPCGDCEGSGERRSPVPEELWFCPEHGPMVVKDWAEPETYGRCQELLDEDSGCGRSMTNYLCSRRVPEDARPAIEASALARLKERLDGAMYINEGDSPEFLEAAQSSVVWSGGTPGLDELQHAIGTFIEAALVPPPDESEEQ